MNKVLNCNSKAGSKKTNKPRHWNHNTDLCVDIKTNLRKDRIAAIGKNYLGVLRHDKECHYTFTETPNADKRNPRVFDGQYITVTRRDNGSLRLNFKYLEVGADFSIDDYAIGVFNELHKALKSLIGERRARK